MLHRNLLLPCPYLVEELEVCEPSLKEMHNGKKTTQRTRRQHTAKHNTCATDTDSSSEEEYHLWTAARPAADPPLNAEAEEFCPRGETSRDRPEVPSAPEENPEEEDVEESYSLEEETEAPAMESKNEQSDAEKWRERPQRARQPRRVYTYDQLGQPTFQQLKTCPVSVREPSGASRDLFSRSSFMYRFCHE